MFDYEQLAQRYHELSGVDLKKSKRDFLDYLYEDLLNELYYDLIDIYKRKCCEIYNSMKDVLAHQNGAVTISNGVYVVDITVPLAEIMGDTEQQKGEYIMRIVVAEVYIRVIDKFWQRHLRNIDSLKQSVQNAYYEQKDPLLVFKFESFQIFSTMMTMINKDVVAFILKGQIIMDKDLRNMSINEIAGVLLENIKKTKDDKKLKALIN
jgi:preprotein translocase subunit SecA